jgi:hypothetical protein
MATGDPVSAIEHPVAGLAGRLQTWQLAGTRLTPTQQFAADA